MKVFFKSFYISSVIVFCIIFGIYGTARAYESIQYVAFGEYKKAVSLDGTVLRIFDYEIELLREND